MVKRGRRLPSINMMRHLVVPNHEVEAVLGHIRAREWGAFSFRVFSSKDGKSRLIPLNPNSPTVLPGELSKYPIEFHKGVLDERIETNWLSLLLQEIDQDVIDSKSEAWPSNHEFIGDMIIVKIDKSVEEYTDSIARAKLGVHPHVRLILADDGVQGEFRIRNLRPIGARLSGRILTGPSLDLAPPEILSTKVSLKESGRVIRCDPTRAYFSTKLQTERLETLSLAKELRNRLDRPIRVADPFCGVGPALAPLLNEADLVNDLLATDLNPDAVELLFENLSKWDRRPYPKNSISVERLYNNRIVGLADATKLENYSEIRSNWDLLIINLPHRTIEYLPYLIPLLDRTGPTMIRGRVIVEESEIFNTNEKINKLLPPLLSGKPKPSLMIKRDYSPSLRLCSFQAWIAPE